MHIYTLSYSGFKIDGEVSISLTKCTTNAFFLCVLCKVYNEKYPQVFERWRLFEPKTDLSITNSPFM